MIEQGAIFKSHIKQWMTDSTSTVPGETHDSLKTIKDRMQSQLETDDVKENKKSVTTICQLFSLFGTRFI